MYKLMVLNWSIFTLSIQLIFCASAVYSNIDSQNEIICNQEPEKFLEEKGSSSSLILELNPGLTHDSCKRLFTPPEYYGFFISLNKIKTNNNKNNNNISNKKLDEGTGTKTQSNLTGSSSCPLNIYSTKDSLLPPWRVDPCQLDYLKSIGDFEEPVRLLEGRIKIVWNHGGNIVPSYKLTITVLGRGQPCKENGKHACLSFGQEPLFCISEDLLCDGIHHCPSGIEYHSDEDSSLCEKKKNIYPKYKSENINLWEKLSMEIFKKIFTNEKSTETLTNKTGKEHILVEKIDVDVNLGTRRGSLSKGLSRYGPWGYLMLGMLLCGGALLICGLWECCCRRQKPSLLSSSDVLVSADFSQGNRASSISTNLPNYDDLDSPPSYSILFPNIKSISDIAIQLPQQQQPEQIISS